MKVHLDGLTVEQWFICIAFGLVIIPWRYLVVATPVTKYMPEMGRK